MNSETSAGRPTAVQPLSRTCRNISDIEPGARDRKPRTTRRTGVGSGAGDPPQLLTAHDTSAVSEAALSYAESLGFDIANHDDRSRAASRRLVADLLLRAGSETRSGRPRWRRVAGCGRLHSAKCGGELGASHAWCHDRACERCQRERMSKLAAQLRRVADARMEAGAALLFVTLTRVKRSTSEENAGAALGGLGTELSYLLNKGKSAAARKLRRYIAGGVRFVEMTWSPRGYRDGSQGPYYVPYSGWHAHLHGIFELTAAPDGVSASQHQREARRALIDAWMTIQHNEVNERAQVVAPLDRARIGQVTKYPLKPFDAPNPRRLIEGVEAFANTRQHQSFGTWIGWVKQAEELREDFGGGHRVIVGPSIAHLRLLEKKKSACVFEDKAGDEVYIIHATIVSAAIRADPRTFAERKADLKKKSRDPTGHLVDRGASAPVVSDNNKQRSEA